MNNPQRHRKEGLTESQQARLIQRLQRREHVPLVPPEVDSRILQHAQQHFERAAFSPRPRRFLWIRLAWATGLAAALVTAAVLWPIRLDNQSDPRSPAPPQIQGDLDRNGRIDILDALALARQLESGDGTPTGSDFNGDGAVNEHDVRDIAMQAVQLSTREGG